MKPKKKNPRNTSILHSCCNSEFKSAQKWMGCRAHLIILRFFQWTSTRSMRTNRFTRPASALSVPLPVFPAVGLLCDGACRKRIGGTFHTLGAAWWGVGSSLMNRVHLAERRGPQDSLVQTWFTDQSRVIPASSSHTQLLWLPLLGVPVVFHLQKVLSSEAWSAFSMISKMLQMKHTSSLNYLFLLMPMVNPEALAVRFSDSLAMLSQVEQSADSFQPSSSTQPVAPTVRR